MQKKHPVVMLPTNNKSDILLVITDKMAYRDRPKGRLERHDCLLSKSDYFQPQHLYILSDEEIKEGDWYIVNNITKQCKSIKKYNPTTENKNEYCVDSLGNEDNTFWCKKIIATTNPELTKQGIPAIPELFITYYIEQYNKGNVITEVNVNYNYTIDKSMGHFHQRKIYKPTLDKDGCIVINTTDVQRTAILNKAQFEGIMSIIREKLPQNDKSLLKLFDSGCEIAVDAINTKQETFTRQEVENIAGSAYQQGKIDQELNKGRGY